MAFFYAVNRPVNPHPDPKDFVFSVTLELDWWAHHCFEIKLVQVNFSGLVTAQPRLGLCRGLKDHNMYIRDNVQTHRRGVLRSNGFVSDEGNGHANDEALVRQIITTTVGCWEMSRIVLGQSIRERNVFFTNSGRRRGFFSKSALKVQF